MAVKTMAERVTKNTVILLLGQVLALGLNFVTVVMLARHWGERRFGIFSYGLVIVGLFALLADFGIKPILVRELSRQRERASSIIASVLGLKLVLSFLAVLFVNGIAVFAFRDMEIRTAILILSFSIPLTSKVSTLRSVFESIFLADMNMKVLVTFELTDALLQLGLIWVFIRLDTAPEWIYLVYGAALLPGFFGCLFMASRQVRIRIAFEKAWIVWFLKESFPLFIYIGLAMLYERLDVLLLQLFYDEARVGIYSSAFRLTAPLIFFPFAVTSALYPVMSRIIEGEEERKELVFSMGLKVLFVLGLALGFFGLIIGPLMYRIVYRGAFTGGLNAFQFLLWGQAFNFLTYFIVDYNSSQNKQKMNARFIVCTLALALAADTLIISRFGVTGAGAAKLLLYVAGAVILIVLSKLHLTRFQVQTFVHVFLLLLILMGAAWCIDILNTGWILQACLMMVLFVGAAVKVFSSREKAYLIKGLMAAVHPDRLPVKV